MSAAPAMLNFRVLTTALLATLGMALFAPMAAANNPMELPAWCSCEEYEHTVDVTPINGYVTITPPLPVFPLGASVRIKFTPNEGYMFSHWSGDIGSPWAASQETDELVIQVTGDMEVTANGMEDTKTVKINFDPSRGTVEGQSVSPYYTTIGVGQTLSLSAAPFQGQRTYWRGIGSVGTPPDHPADLTGFQFGNSITLMGDLSDPQF